MEGGGAEWSRPGGWLIRPAGEEWAASDLQGGLLPLVEWCGGANVGRRQPGEVGRSVPISLYLLMVLYLIAQSQVEGRPGAQGVPDRSVSEDRGTPSVGDAPGR